MTINIPERLYKAMKKPSMSTTRGRSGLYPAEASVKIGDEVYGACARRVFFSWNSYADDDDEINPDWSLAADAGNWYHEGLVSLIRHLSYDMDLSVLFEEQSFYDQDNMISGRTDILLIDTKTNEMLGVDIKSVGDWKSKQCLEWPSIDHILQCAVYLHLFQKHAKKGSEPLKKWAILYIGRSENWELKKNAHGSPYKMLWQFDMDIEQGYVTVQNQHGATKEYKDITIDAILDRYKYILKHIKTRSLPDRDYEAQYSEEKITALHKAGQLQFKKDNEAVEKWLKKGAKEGELGLTMGDSECMFCSHKVKCYSADPLSSPKKDFELYDIKKSNEPTKPKEKMF